MTPRTASRLAWACAAIAICGLTLGVALAVSGTHGLRADDLVFLVETVVFASVGLLVASRRPRNAIGWIFLGLALASGLLVALVEIAHRTATGDPTSTAARLVAWSDAWTWVPFVFIPTLFPLLLFPDGHLASPRWRPVAWATAVGIVAFSMGSAFDPANFDGGPNPLGVELPHLLVSVLDAATLLLPVGLVGGVASVVVRFRRAEGDERQQLRWLTYTGITTAGLLLASGVAGGIMTAAGVDLNEGSTASGILNSVVLLSVLAIPVGMGIAIVKYHLYDIDLVVSKALVYAVLAVFISIVYVGVVVGVGWLVGSGGNVALSAVAAAVVALAFQPARRWAQRIANRVVYGKRATPYEVLAELSGRFAGTYSLDDALPRLARVVAEGVGGEQAVVWLRAGQVLRPVGIWPQGDPPSPPSITDDGELGEGVANGFPLRHQGELLGAISVTMPPSDPLRGATERLVEDLAAQAGLVVRNVALLEDLRASRQRLVAAQDDERRKLERNIHDGAQQQLVALAVKQRLASSFIGKDDERARDMLEQLQAETNAALEDLRDLARGIYPPLLADKGLRAALEAQARKSLVPTTVDAQEIGRVGQDVEAAVYFSCLEALQNVAKYAEATHATVQLTNGDGTLGFVVSDNGRGFEPSTTGYGTGLQGIADRLAALGGSLEVRSQPGRGTDVSGTVPVVSAS